jgi:hypothetical protein
MNKQEVNYDEAPDPEVTTTVVRGVNIPGLAELPVSDIELAEMANTVEWDDVLEVAVELDPWFTYRTPDDKAKLVGSPFVVLKTKLMQSTSYEEVTIAVCYCKTEDGRLIKIVDSSTGICAQVQDLRRTHPNKPIVCRNGLSVSEYEVEVAGKRTKAKTYYLA